jgi:hypothetical protein
MAYVEHGMWEVLEVLRRIHKGESVRSTARSTGRDKKTVKRYAAAAAEVGWVAGTHEPSEDLAREVLAALRPGPKESDEANKIEQRLMPHIKQIEKWLKPDGFYKRGLRLTKVHILLKRMGVETSYAGLYRFAVKHLGYGEKKLTVRMADVSPGEVAEVDFGLLGFVPDSETGKQRVVHALVVTLVYSRHQYVHVTHSQKLEDLILGLEEAWAFFGGVTHRVVVDNLKAAVVRADRYDPTFQRTFNEYAEHCGFTIDAAVSKSPTHKPHVERQVPYVRDNFFRGEQFLSREDTQRRAEKWCLETAGKRVHGTTRRQPFIEFEAFEKEALLPKNEERFDTPKWAEPKVHPDCHVRFQNALYSVPYQYRGKKTTVRGDSRLVRIYIGGNLVKTHKRMDAGKRSTDEADYPQEKSAYAMRDAKYIIQKAKEKGEQIGVFAERLLSGDFPWSMLRQSQKLLRLCDKYGEKIMETACQRALSFDLINVKRLENIVKGGLDKRVSDIGRSNSEAEVIQLPLGFFRNNHSFNRTNRPQEK